MLTVADIMTREVVTVTPETTLREAAITMLQHGVSGLPVVDGEGSLVGIVSEADFVDQEATHDWASRYRLLDPLYGRGERALAAAERVGDVMTRSLLTVRPDARVAEAARRMASGVKRLPVVADGALVGIVSRADVLRVFAREDGDIAAEVRELLERRLLPVEPGEVQVAVVDGVVTLRGAVDARVDAAILADLVGRFDGVVRVDNQLEWEVDDRIPEQRFPGYPQEGSEE